MKAKKLFAITAATLLLFSFLTAGETSYPLTVTVFDASGQEMRQTVSKRPTRVVTSNVSSTEILLKLGLKDTIIGILKPDNKITNKYAADFASFKVIGDKKSLSKEAVLAAQPDIIVGRDKLFNAKALGDFATVRTGRANPAMFNKIEAEYYGTPTPLQQLATFQSPEPRVMLITPYDRSAMNAIEKAIRNSDLGVNPASDGTSIRVVLPELTEKRRKEYIKIVKAKAEEARVALRNVRRHAVDAVKKAEKDKQIGGDEAKRAEKKLDEETKKSVEAVDELLKAKEAELMAV